MEKEISLVRVAQQTLNEVGKPLSFNDLSTAVIDKIGIDEEAKLQAKIDLHQSITLSGVFLYLGEGLWDIKIRHSKDSRDLEYFDTFEVEEEVVEVVPEISKPLLEIDDSSEYLSEIPTLEEEYESFDDIDDTTFTEDFTIYGNDEIAVKNDDEFEKELEYGEEYSDLYDE